MYFLIAVSNCPCVVLFDAYDLQGSWFASNTLGRLENARKDAGFLLFVGGCWWAQPPYNLFYYFLGYR